MSYTVRRIDSIEEFRALAPVWSELTRESGQTSPFLSHDWFSCCWLTSGPERHPEVLVIDEGSQPVAIIPLSRWKGNIRGLPVRMISLLDSPDTPFADFLIAGQHDAVIKTFLDYQRGRSDWDLINLKKIPVSSPARKSLEAHLSERDDWRQTGSEHSPYLELSGSWSDFYGGKTQRFRKTCRNIQNKLERAGTVTVEEHRVVDPDTPFFAEVLEVSRQSWKGDQGVAMATMPRMPEFFAELKRRASRNGWLRLWLLRLNGHAVAMEYQIESAGTVYALRADFAYGVREFSPGAYLNFRIVQSLFEQGGVREYDMGPGNNEYKLRWASGSHETVGLEIYRKSLYAKLIHTLETKAVPVLRKLRDRARSKGVEEVVAQ